MLTEEFITKVETKIKAKYPTGLKGLVSEVYIMQVDGRMLMLPYMDRNPIAAQANAIRIKMIVAVLGRAQRLSGIVQVSSGWIVDGKVDDKLPANPMLCANKKEILMFNAKGETGERIRVYEIRRIKGKRLPAKLAGTFESLSKGGD